MVEIIDAIKEFVEYFFLCAITGKFCAHKDCEYCIVAHDHKKYLVCWRCPHFVKPQTRPEPRVYYCTKTGAPPPAYLKYCTYQPKEEEEPKQ
jgi:hypothetical protein